MDANKIYSQMSRSTFLKGTDIQGKEVTVTINKVEVVEQERENQTTGEKYKVPQFVLSFEGNEKRLGLNVGNTERMIQMHGGETDDWVGKEITLYTEMVSNPQGQRVPGIRIMQKSSAGPAPEPYGLDTTEDVDMDSIPF